MPDIRGELQSFDCQKDEFNHPGDCAPFNAAYRHQEPANFSTPALARSGFTVE
jgi:hypothetical protein